MVLLFSKYYLKLKYQCNSFDTFIFSAPFTIQRLCELLCAPRKHYKRTDKFMRGIEKNLLVVSTVDPEQRYVDNFFLSNVASELIKFNL